MDLFRSVQYKHQRSHYPTSASIFEATNRQLSSSTDLRTNVGEKTPAPNRISSVNASVRESPTPAAKTKIRGRSINSLAAIVSGHKAETRKPVKK